MSRNEYMRKYYKERGNKEPWWKVYISVKSRCCNKKRNWYKRGRKCLITIQEIKILWFRDKAFNMKRPSIDRIDNDGNYTLENCRFIELSENSRLGNIGNRIKRGKYQKNVGRSALKMREWRERKYGREL